MLKNPKLTIHSVDDKLHGMRAELLLENIFNRFSNKVYCTINCVVV